MQNCRKASWPVWQDFLVVGAKEKDSIFFLATFNSAKSLRGSPLVGGWPRGPAGKTVGSESERENQQFHLTCLQHVGHEIKKYTAC